MGNKAFSLLELLMTLLVMGMLMAIGGTIYTKHKKGSYKYWAKTELVEIARLMNMAKSADGYYHQYIYAMGYRPKGPIFAVVGTAASNATICCDQYPTPGTSPCKKNYKSGFIYYNCKNTTLHLSRDNVAICDDSAYSSSCSKKLAVSGSLQTSDFSSCAPSPSTWCNCSQFTVGAIIPHSSTDKKELSLNQSGKLCEGS